MEISGLYGKYRASKLNGEEFKVPVPANRKERRKLVKLQLRSCKEVAILMESEQYCEAEHICEFISLVDAQTGYSKTEEGENHLFRIELGLPKGSEFAFSWMDAIKRKALFDEWAAVKTLSFDEWEMIDCRFIN